MTDDPVVPIERRRFTCPRCQVRYRYLFLIANDLELIDCECGLVCWYDRKADKLLDAAKQRLEKRWFELVE